MSLSSSKVTSIEIEFGESIYSVIRGFAEMGYSRSDAAGALGYDRSHFTRHVLRVVDPECSIPWPSRGRGRSVLEGIATRTTENRQWLENIRAAAKRRRREVQ